MEKKSGSLNDESILYMSSHTVVHNSPHSPLAMLLSITMFGPGEALLTTIRISDSFFCSYINVIRMFVILSSTFSEAIPGACKRNRVGFFQHVQPCPRCKGGFI